MPIDRGDTFIWQKRPVVGCIAVGVCLVRVRLTSSSLSLHNPCNHSWLILTKPLLFLKLFKFVNGGGALSMRPPGDRLQIKVIIII